MLKKSRLFSVFKTLFLVTVFLLILLISYVLLFELYPSELQVYLPDLNLQAKKMIIPNELCELRFRNQSAMGELYKASTNLNLLQSKKKILLNEVETLNKLVASESYNVNPSDAKLLEQVKMEKRLLNKELKHKQPYPGFFELLAYAYYAFCVYYEISNHYNHYGGGIK